MTTSALSPGTILAATDALCFRRGRGWSDEEVAHLVRLAYDTGRLHGWAADMAELEGCWREHAEPRKTRQDRIAERLAAMPSPKPQRYDDPDWPPVAVPGAGGVRLGPGQIVPPSGPPLTYLPADRERCK